MNQNDRDRIDATVPVRAQSVFINRDRVESGDPLAPSDFVGEVWKLFPCAEREPVYFHPCNLHWTLPYSGNRISIIFFTHRNQKA